ncbi:PqqD family protein [Kitasatospora sp. NPDC093558]|uniref:PqqD family protein n=1 Tax=Kitasatospora sp. NPDC093558 TaxID=3155201 RepID=UPI003415F5E8
MVQLNATAAQVLEVLAASGDLEQVCSVLRARFPHVPESVIRRDIDTLLDSLRKHGAVAGA